MKDKMKGLPFKGLLLIVLIIIIIVTVMKVGNINLLSNLSKDASDTIIGKDGEVSTITETSLQKVLTTSNLSTADYAYNAIAYAYEEDGTTVKYYVAYEGTVTAGIDFSQIEINVDEDKKTITLKLPDCQIQDTTVDFGSMEYIFEDETYNDETVSEEAYKICESDLEERAAKEEDLLKLAKENAVDTVKALVSPWVEQVNSDYSVTIE